MTTLFVGPESPAWMHMAADALLVMHVGGGALGLVSGAVAVTVRKGERLHRLAGNVFFVSMLSMAGIGAAVAPFLTDGQRPNFVAGVMTLYLLVTAWFAARQERVGAGTSMVVGFIVATLIAAAGAIFAIMASQSPTGTIDDSPPQAFYMFMGLGSIAALCDLRVILRGGISGAQRIARHLWRMCVALFIASESFFLGQQKFLPEAIHGTVVQFGPVFFPIVLMIFWLLRVLLTRWWQEPVSALTTAHGDNNASWRKEK